MNTRSRLTITWLGYFALVLLPSFLVLVFFLLDRVLNQLVLAGMLVLAVFLTLAVISVARGGGT